MDQSPCEGTTLAFIEAAVFALEEARRLLLQEKKEQDAHPITRAFLALDD